jgi:hypothetical protein
MLHAGFSCALLCDIHGDPRIELDCGITGSEFDFRFCEMLSKLCLFSVSLQYSCLRMLLARVCFLLSRLPRPISFFSSSICSMRDFHDNTVDSYRPHLLPIIPGADHDANGPIIEDDWTADLELTQATALADKVFGTEPLRVLVLYGSLRHR